MDDSGRYYRDRHITMTIISCVTSAVSNFTRVDMCDWLCVCLCVYTRFRAFNVCEWVRGWECISLSCNIERRACKFGSISVTIIIISSNETTRCHICCQRWWFCCDQREWERLRCGDKGAGGPGRALFFQHRRKAGPLRLQRQSWRRQLAVTAQKSGVAHTL